MRTFSSNDYLNVIYDPNRHSITKIHFFFLGGSGIILDLHAELYKDSEGEETSETCYLIVLTTSRGTFKLDMGDDFQRYKTWATTINHLLLLSSSITKYATLL